MFMEFAKPVSLIFCILSLYALFHAAFLNPASDLDQRVYESLHFLALAACVSIASAVVFQSTQESCARRARFAATLPMQMFCWAAGVMFVLFVVSLYLESHCIFYKDVRVF
jgi:disulfide bond formation protein DsbB